MKRNILIFFLACTMLFACKKDEKFLYDETTDNIYLDYPTEDLLTYTFAYHPELAKDTIWIPVKISGKRVDHDRKFSLKSVETTLSSALRGFHYEEFKPFYVMPADSGVVHVPLIIFNAEGLTGESVFLSFQVSGGEDFKTALPEKLRTRTITFSNRLEQPVWWVYWLGELGMYSRTKHQLFLISSGTINLSNPATEFMDTPRSLYYISNARNFLRYPFEWVEQNPDKGYVLTKRTDDTNDYDFYNVNNPAVKFHLKYFQSAGTYVFMDENGLQISM